MGIDSIICSTHYFASLHYDYRPKFNGGNSTFFEHLPWMDGWIELISNALSISSVRPEIFLVRKPTHLQFHFFKILEHSSRALWIWWYCAYSLVIGCRWGAFGIKQVKSHWTIEQTCSPPARISLECFHEIRMAALWPPLRDTLD